MANSMTGFARVSVKEEWGSATWELRSVNHRYLDLSLKLPDAFRFIEPECRQVVRNMVPRGKLECQLRYQLTNQSAQQWQLNEGVVKNILQLSSQLDQHADLQPLASIDVLRWPDAIQTRDTDYSAMGKSILGGLEDALKQLQTTRQTEGDQLVGVVDDRLQQLKQHLEQIKESAPQMNETYRTKLLARLEELDVEHDTSRFDQELAYIAQKTDIDEELDRLSLHISETEKIMKRSEPIGRRLDFLMQEFNREANTIGSKITDKNMTQVVVEMKVLIEQMREQIQNIE